MESNMKHFFYIFTFENEFHSMNNNIKMKIKQYNLWRIMRITSSGSYFLNNIIIKVLFRYKIILA